MSDVQELRESFLNAFPAAALLLWQDRIVAVNGAVRRRLPQLEPGEPIPPELLALSGEGGGLVTLGGAAWRVLPLLWMAMPIASVVLIATAPFAAESGAESGGMRVRDLLRQPLVLVAMVIMTCAGASELTMSQWASTFAERGLHVTKVLGDLLGPCLFAVFMGLGRMLYGKLGSRLPLKKSLMGCAILCIVCYLTAALSPVPFLALMGCAVCGFSVSLMWPGSLSMAAARFPFGGTALFAILAVMGDLGCSVGPWLAGAVSDAAQGVPALTEFAAQSGLTLEQLGLKSGLLLGVIFPVILLIGTAFVQEPRYARKD